MTSIRPPTSDDTLLTTAMASLALLPRAHHAARRLASQMSSHTFLVPAHRHAMMSALSHDRPPPPTASSSKSKSTSPSPLFGDTLPVAVPSSTPSKPPTAKSLSPNAASPQVAARPPPVPRAERPRPTIRATKAAITVVCNFSVMCGTPFLIARLPLFACRRLPPSSDYGTSSRARPHR